MKEFNFVLLKERLMQSCLNSNSKYCLRAKDTSQGLVALSCEVFLFVWRLFHYIGFLIQFFPSLILSRVIQNKGQQTDRLIKVCAMTELSSHDLQDLRGFNRMLKTVITTNRVLLKDWSWGANCSF